MNHSRLTELWKRQPLDTSVVAPDATRTKANQLRSTIWRRNRGEYAAGVFVIVGNLIDLWLYPDLLSRISCVLVILGILVVMHQLYRRTAIPASAPERLGLPASVYYRAELVRQRDALRSVFFWYLLPLAPGIELFFLARQLQLHEPTKIWIYLLFPAMAAVIVWLNLRAARTLQRQIDELDRETTGDVS